MDRRNDVCQIALVERHRATGGVTNAFVSGFGYDGRMAPWPRPWRMTPTTSSCVGTDQARHGAGGQPAGAKSAVASCCSRKGKELALVETADRRADVGRARRQSVAAKAQKLVEAMRKMGCVREPCLAELLLALVVIPELRISDVGLIDVTTFQKVDLFV